MTDNVRYCYFVCGHIRVQPPTGQEPYTAPFDHVIRSAVPVTDNDGLAILTGQLKDDITTELHRVTDQYHMLAGDPVVRQVSLLHTVMVKDDQVVRVVS
jgi:hypothetical protein